MKLTPASERLAYPVREACQKLGIGRTSLYEMKRKGEIILIRIAGRTLVPHSEIERLTRIDQTLQVDHTF
jgi:excisionase family DNA binding protein